jgi:hypothetical protein
VTKAAYPTPEEAILAFVRRRREDPGEITYFETDGKWAVGNVTSVVNGGTISYVVFVMKGDGEGGWTFRGGGGGRSGVGCNWVLAPERGEAGHDGRKGVALFSIDVPPDADELRVWYRTRHLSLRPRVETAPVRNGRAFMTIWDCHATWGTTRMQARRAGRWEHLDLRTAPCRFEPLRERVAFRWRGQRGWYEYPSDTRWRRINPTPLHRSRRSG